MIDPFDGPRAVVGGASVACGRADRPPPISPNGTAAGDHVLETIVTADGDGVREPTTLTDTPTFGA